MRHAKRMTSSRRGAIAAASLSFAIVVAACGGDSNEGSAAEESGDNATESSGEIYDLLPESVQEAGELRVATDANYPPCDFMNDDGEIDGYNHSILMAMEPHLGVDIVQESIQFDGLIPGVQSGRYDVAMECISDNEERREVVQFVNNAYGMNGIMVLEDNPAGVTENPLSLCGVSTGVQTGTNFGLNAERHSENCLEEGLEPLDVTEFPSASDVNTALESGRIDATFTSLSVARYQQQEGRPVLGLASPLIAQDYHGIVVGIDNDELAEALLAALEAAIEDGTYQEAMEGWNLEELMLLEPGINLGGSDPIEEPELCGSCGQD